MPVTLKMRLGWDENSINAPLIARRAQEAGVQMITIHGRTRMQFYNGTADWDAIRAVRDVISVPLVANGDVATREDASEILRRSGADAVMIGRSSQGRPWHAGVLAGRADHPDAAGIADIVAEHYGMMLEFYGADIGLRHARKTSRLVSQPVCAATCSAGQGGDHDLHGARHRPVGCCGRHCGRDWPWRTEGCGMTEKMGDEERRAVNSLPMAVLNAIQNPVILVDEKGLVAFANWEAEAFFGASANYLARHDISAFIPFGSPLLTLIEQVRERRAAVNEYRVDLSSPRLGTDKLVDLYVAPVLSEPGSVVIVFQERSMADKIDRQLTHRAAARSVTGLASMLAHEIKNPLSGIRGAAPAARNLRQRRRPGADEADLRRDRPDRIAGRSHGSLFRRAAGRPSSGQHPFGARSCEGHRQGRLCPQDPHHRELRSVAAARLCHRDQLIQVFLNLIKNAAEAVADKPDGEIMLTTAYRPGIRLSVAGTREKISLPLEFCVHDNGPGLPSDLVPHLFDPFITTKTNGSGLGLALVAKIIGGHGGIVECDSSRAARHFAF